MIIKIVVLIVLIRLLIQTDKPLLCSALYSFIGFSLGFLCITGYQMPLFSLVIATARTPTGKLEIGLIGTMESSFG